MKFSWRHTRDLRSLCGERGAAFIEFAIATPLLILLVMSTVELGRAYRNVTLVSQGAYNAALAGGSVPTTVGRETITNTFGEIFGLRDTKGKDTFQQDIDTSVSSSFDNTAKTVNVSYTNGINSIFGNMLLGVRNLSYVGPILSKSANNGTTLNQFGAPGGGCFYDCAGHKQCSGSPNTQPCLNGQPYNPPPDPGELCALGQCVPGLCPDNCPVLECRWETIGGRIRIKVCELF